MKDPLDFEVNLGPVEISDLRSIARVHIESFPDSALTKLGPKIVERYYLWQMAGPHEKVRATLATVSDRCAGFSFSGIFSGSTSGFIKRNWLSLTGAVLRRPHLILDDLFLGRLNEGLRLLARFRRKTTTISPTRTSAGFPNYGILAIAVAPRYQKLGVGQMLMGYAEDEAVRSGCRQICLTVHPDNVKAVRFYERQNWQKFMTGALWNGAMTKKLR